MLLDDLLVLRLNVSGAATAMHSRMPSSIIQFAPQLVGLDSQIGHLLRFFIGP